MEYFPGRLHVHGFKHCAVTHSSGFNKGFYLRPTCCCVLITLGGFRTLVCLQVCFEVKITKHLATDFGDDHTEADPHVLRIGWSVDGPGFQLGIHNNHVNAVPTILPFWGCQVKLFLKSLFASATAFAKFPMCFALRIKIVDVVDAPFVFQLHHFALGAFLRP